MDGKVIQGRKIYVARSKPTIKRDETTLYLGNLPFTTDEEQIKEAMVEYGDKIEEIKIVRN